MTEDAIKLTLIPEGVGWVEFNKKWSQKWEVIDTQKESCPIRKHSGEANKLEKYFKDK